MQGWTHHVAEAIANDVDDHGKTNQRDHQDEERPEMPFLKAPQRACESYQSEQCRHDDHGVHAYALPIAAAEVQPHAKFIERQAHRHAIQQRRDFRFATCWPTEHAVTADARQQKNSIVQMMHVRAAHEAIKIRHRVCHNQKDKHARQNERYNETEQRITRQLVGGFASEMMFGVHDFGIYGIE